MIYVMLLGFVLGQAAWYVPMRIHAHRHHDRTLRAIWRFFTGYRVRVNDPVNLIIERKQRAAELMAKAQDKIPLAIPEAWLERYGNAIFRPAIDDLTGASVFEVDVKDWSLVRMLELNIWGCYWHTRAGEYLPAGITPDEEAAARAPRPLTAAERNEPQQVVTQNWWAQRMAEQEQLYTVAPVPTQDQVTEMRAAWKELVAAAELAQEDPPYPWGAGVTKRLREADVMLPPIERMAKWDYTQNDTYLALTVWYEGGTVYRAIRNHAGVWNVTVGSLADLTSDLIASGIVS